MPDKLTVEEGFGNIDWFLNNSRIDPLKIASVQVQLGDTLMPVWEAKPVRVLRRDRRFRRLPTDIAVSARLRGLNLLVGLAENPDLLDAVVKVNLVTDRAQPERRICHTCGHVEGHCGQC